MKILYVLVSLSFALASCGPTLLVNRDDLKRIPIGSTKVVTKTQLSPDDTFSLLAKNFAKSGCPVQSDKSAMQVICAGKSIEGGTMLKALAFIEGNETGSLVTMSGEWALSASSQAGMAALFGASGITSSERIVWRGVASTKPCIAFQHLVLMSISIPDGMVKYEK